MKSIDCQKYQHRGHPNAWVRKRFVEARYKYVQHQEGTVWKGSSQLTPYIKMEEAMENSDDSEGKGSKRTSITPGMKGGDDAGVKHGHRDIMLKGELATHRRQLQIYTSC